jgi:hypothetical protein
VLSLVASILVLRIARPAPLAFATA